MIRRTLLLLLVVIVGESTVRTKVHYRIVKRAKRRRLHEGAVAPVLRPAKRSPSICGCCSANVSRIHKASAVQ